MQNRLTKLGAVTTTCNILIKSTNNTIIFEGILLGITLLIGGNNNSQKAFLNFVDDDPKNLLIKSLFKIIDENFN